jgi:hypothetical protein
MTKAAQRTDKKKSVKALNDWEDGTPKSFGTAFTAHLTGEPSIFADDKFFQPHRLDGGTKSRSETASASREAQESRGNNIGSIAGLSAASENRSMVDPRRFHVFAKVIPA